MQQLIAVIAAPDRSVAPLILVNLRLARTRISVAVFTQQLALRTLEWNAYSAHTDDVGDPHTIGVLLWEGRNAARDSTELLLAGTIWGLPA
jgi:hypothetical protein